MRLHAPAAEPQPSLNRPPPPQFNAAARDHAAFGGEASAQLSRLARGVASQRHGGGSIPSAFAFVMDTPSRAAMRHASVAHTSAQMQPATPGGSAIQPGGPDGPDAFGAFGGGGAFDGGGAFGGDLERYLRDRMNLFDVAPPPGMAPRPHILAPRRAPRAGPAAPDGDPLLAALMQQHAAAMAAAWGGPGPGPLAAAAFEPSPPSSLRTPAVSEVHQLPRSQPPPVQRFGGRRAPPPVFADRPPSQRSQRSEQQDAATAAAALAAAAALGFLEDAASAAQP